MAPNHPRHSARDSIRDRSRPAFASVSPGSTYWSVEQSEWATDVVFGSPADLAALDPRLVHHGITTFSSRDVLRFLQQQVPAHGGVHGHFAGEVTSDLKARPKGVRIKHVSGLNSVKLYDKQGQILEVRRAESRQPAWVETTIRGDSAEPITIRMSPSAVRNPLDPR